MRTPQTFYVSRAGVTSVEYRVLQVPVVKNKQALRLIHEASCADSLKFYVRTGMYLMAKRDTNPLLMGDGMIIRSCCVELDTINRKT